MISPKLYTIEEFLGTTNYSGASFSSDNRKLLVSSDASGIYNAYTLHVGNRTLEQLTHSTADSIFVIGYFPEDERFLYQSDRGGNELSHVYVQTPDGTVTDLTPGEDLKAFFAGWAQDDQSFFICTNERDPRFFDVYEYDANAYQRSLLYQNEAGYNFAEITSDRRYLALAKTETNANSDIYLYDCTTGHLEKITSHDGDINHHPLFFSIDGQHLYYTTDEDSEFLYLMRYTLASGDRQKIEDAEWDIFDASLSKHGKYLMININNDARTELRIYDTATMTPVDLPQLPKCVHSRAFPPGGSPSARRWRRKWEI